MRKRPTTEDEEIEDEAVTDSRCLSRDTWLCGQELESYGAVWEGPITWEFPALLPTIRKKLAGNDTTKCFIFGSTEPQQFELADGIKVLPIPVIIIALTSASKMPEMLGLTSVQRAREDILPMRALKMSWVPWVAPSSSSKHRKLHKAQDCAAGRTFSLHCTLRNSGRGPFVSEERRKQFDYAMPYILRSKDLSEVPEEVAHVAVQYLAKSGKLIEFGFDKEVDRTQIFIPELIEDHGLDESEFEDIKNALKDAFKSARAEEASRLESMRANLSALSEQDLQGLDAMELIKFYPDSKLIDPRVKTAFINRYYGHADELL